MDIYHIPSVKELLSSNTYPGRGILLGKTPNGKYAVAAYFIMGRSANSRNRVFAEYGDVLKTEPFDASKVEDPSLIIYAAMRTLENKLIVTNGDQTDTVYAGLQAGKGFSDSLASRCFEPDAPHFTPRISGLMTIENGDCAYEMSILKSADPLGTACARFTYDYPALPGLGHLLHTYVCDGTPLPTFQGEPKRVRTEDDPDIFTETLWNALDENNRISLHVRYIDLKDSTVLKRTVNRNRS